MNKLQLIGLMWCLDKESFQTPPTPHHHHHLFFNFIFLNWIALLAAAMGNIAWPNRYHYVDIIWQEDASCALSKTNTASVSQHDPIKAVCTDIHTHVHTHKLAKRHKEVRMHTSMCTHCIWMNCMHRDTQKYKHESSVQSRAVSV